MAELKLVRLDYRLIHGQVVTQWTRVSEANRIVIANDELAADSFMADIYRMAAPRGVRVDVFAVEDACAAWKENTFGEGNVLMLFKSAQDALCAKQGGLAFDDLQVGGCGGGKDTFTACGIAFRRADIDALKEIEAMGTRVHVQVVPTSVDYPLSQVIEKLNF